MIKTDEIITEEEINRVVESVNRVFDKNQHPYGERVHEAQKQWVIVNILSSMVRKKLNENKNK